MAFNYSGRRNKYGRKPNYLLALVYGGNKLEQHPRGSGKFQQYRRPGVPPYVSQDILIPKAHPSLLAVSRKGSEMSMGSGVKW